MKNYFKMTLAALLFAGTFTSCDDDDTALPETAYSTYAENFGTIDESGAYTFTFEDDDEENGIDEHWTVFAESGTKNWFINDFGGNVYLEFSSFGSGESSNIGWVVSQPINIDAAKLKRLTFQSAQHHATSLDNKFELLISTNFDGTDVLAADWDLKTFRLPPYFTANNYDFYYSGAVDLSAYSGEIYIAFRVKGNTSTQAGGFQIDNINVF